MRVELSKDEAEVIRGALQCIHGGEELDRLADLFRPRERYMAALRPEVGCPGGPLVPTCPRCGEQAFGYRNTTEQYWEPGEIIPDGQDGGGGVVGHLSTGWEGVGEGDGYPGTFCDNYSGNGCGAAIDLPEGWGILWD